MARSAANATCVGLIGCSVAHEPEVGHAGAEAGGTRKLHHDLVAEGSERGPIKGHGPRVILNAKADVVEHGRDNSSVARGLHGAGLHARGIVTNRPRCATLTNQLTAVADLGRAQRREPKRELAGPVRHSAAFGAGLPDGVSHARLAGAGAARRRGVCCRSTAISPTSRRSPVRAPRDSGSCRRCSGSARATARLRAAGWIGVVALAGGAGRIHQRASFSTVLVRAADLDLQRRADVLRVRLGAAAGRDRIPLHLSLSAARRPSVPAPAAAARGDLAPALAGDADHVGRRAHQAARRLLLARSHLSRFSFRDAAGPESADLVLSTRCRTGRTWSASSSTTSSSWARRF